MFAPKRWRKRKSPGQRVSLTIEYIVCLSETKKPLLNTCGCRPQDDTLTICEQKTLYFAVIATYQSLYSFRRRIATFTSTRRSMDTSSETHLPAAMRRLSCACLRLGYPRRLPESHSKANKEASHLANVVMTYLL